ncbi:MAG: MmgE/PrpD family protein [Chloroflexi bacterium]|nr:MmgE/PrpD family protein [Chloroflexota bacterium]
MTIVEQLAEFVVRASWDRISDLAQEALRVRMLDALGCAIGALDGGPVRAVRAQIEDFGGNPLAALTGGGRTAPDRAAFFNSALVRYLDFNDAYLAKGETCHPSDCLGAILAGSDYAGADGRTLLTAMAVSYQVQCRLSDEAPVRARGFDHTTQAAYAFAAGVAKVLGLDAARTANAIAIAGTSLNALRVTRTGALSHWKGLAAPNTAFGATHAAFLAMRGITGPSEVFEGNKGFREAISGPFVIDWSREDLERVRTTIVKKYNAEIHAQSAIEGLLELRDAYGLTAAQVERIEVEVFDVAYNIIGGGEEGEKTTIRTKEDADHSLPYLLAVALLDGQVMPEQFAPDRLRRKDVQALLRRVTVRPNEEFSRRFPQEHPARVHILLRDGRELVQEKHDYEGFTTRPARWETVVAKFERLSAPYADAGLQQEIVAATRRLERIKASDLTGLLSRVEAPGTQRATT